MGITLEHLNSVNRCQIAEMEKAAKEFDPNKSGSGETFSLHVRSVQAAVIHTYHLTAFASLREPDAARAAVLWKEMVTFCEQALTSLKLLKERYPLCGASELYDLALDYRSEAEKRYHQNLQDAECARMPTPNGLFPKLS